MINTTIDQRGNTHYTHTPTNGGRWYELFFFDNQLGWVVLGWQPCEDSDDNECVYANECGPDGHETALADFNRLTA